MVQWIVETWAVDPVGTIIYGVGAVVVVVYTAFYWGRILYLWSRGESWD